MVEGVRIGGDDDPLQHKVPGPREPDISVLKTAQYRRAKQVGGGDIRWKACYRENDPEEPGTDDEFNGMMTKGCRYIEIGIGVMQRMKAPQPWHRVKKPVGPIAHKIEKQKTHREVCDRMQLGPLQQADAEASLDAYCGIGRSGKHPCQQRTVNEIDCKITEPTRAHRAAQRSTRPQKLPQRDEEEATEQKDETRRRPSLPNPELLHFLALRRCR